MKKTTEQFIVEAKGVHGDKYDYSKVQYVNNHTKICIICPIHGEFLQMPSNHIKGAGCPICAKLAQGISQEDARERINKVLVNTNYTIIEPFIYLGDRDTKVDLFCPKHNYKWSSSWHQLIFDYNRKGDYCGCKFCKIIYSKDKCLQAAKKCSLRSEFAKLYKGEYFAALRNGWLDDICSHMQVLGNRYRRCIYAYEFNNINEPKYVYVGLTENVSQRDKLHRRRGSVYSFCQLHHVEMPDPIILTDYVEKEEAAQLEGLFLDDYIEKGWTPINIKKTGGLGGHTMNSGFTFEECKKIGQKYPQRSDWKKYDYPSYYIASKHKWIDKILKQKERFGNSQQRYWTKERVREIALQFDTISNFRAAYPSVYTVAWKNNWLEEVCAHMKRLLSPTNYSIDIIINEIEKYDTLSDFISQCPRMYNWLNKHKIKLTDISDKKYKTPKLNKKKVYQYSINGDFIRSFECARDAVPYGFNYKDISAVCNGHKKTHKGYIFRFDPDKE